MRVVHELRVFLARPEPPPEPRVMQPQSTPPVELRFLTLNPLGLEDAGRIVQLAESYGFAIGMQRDQVQLVEGDPHAELHIAVESECKAQLGLRDGDGAQVDADDARLNALEHDVRNLGRGQNQISGLLQSLSGQISQLAARVLGPSEANQVQDQAVAGLPRVEYKPAGMTRFVAPGASMPIAGLPLPVVPTPVPITPSLSTAQANSQAMGLPLIGTPPPFVGDMSAPLNPRARGASLTPEMSSGQLSIHGPQASSTIVMYTGKVNDKGEPIMDIHTLPTVGDSLRGPVSDIKVD